MKLRDRVLWLPVLTGIAVLMAGCATTGDPTMGAAAPMPAERSIAKGPAADYPMVLGDPYVIDGVTYTPRDTLNVDDVGYAAGDTAAAGGVTASHHTLPLPSYVEVTALDTGKTALVRVERRGPMTNDRLVALSPDAMAQLGIAEGAAVRVRRVNPPEADRAKLREGKAAAPRMVTPSGLLEVLRRKLPATGSVSLRNPLQDQISGKVPTAGAIAALAPVAAAAPAATTEERSPPPVAAHEAVAETAPLNAPQGRYAVQVGAFSVHGNARALAEKLQGFVVTEGKFALVRAGPYVNRGQAAQALAKLRDGGYSDARIVTLK